MFSIFFHLIVLLTSLANSKPFTVFGYLPEYRYASIDFSSLFSSLTHLIFFSIEVDPTGTLTALDRFPSPEILLQAQQAARQWDGKLLISLGGNSRTNGFPIVVHSEELRQKFINNLVQLIQENNLDGVDFNWEYPRNQEDWDALFQVFKELKQYLAPLNKIITMAYYPDHAQEMILSQGKASENIDYFLSMSYDTYQEHSTMKFAQQTISNAKEYLPLSQVTLGLPFYGRNIMTGMPRTYAELVPFINNYSQDLVQLPEEQQYGMQFFNSKETIKEKTRMAKEQGLGGVMIWEIGQDVHFEREESLLRAIYEELHQINHNNQEQEEQDNQKQEDIQANQEL